MFLLFSRMTILIKVQSVKYYHNLLLIEFFITTLHVVKCGMCTCYTINAYTNTVNTMSSKKINFTFFAAIMYRRQSNPIVTL